MLSPQDVTRFWSHVNVAGPEVCWEWTACRWKQIRYRNGRRGGGPYGIFGVGGKNKGAHRISYEIANGEIPQGAFILHSCDNPPCVNPAHLRIGTAKENTHDAISRGRAFDIGSRMPSDLRARGERHGSRTHPERVRRGDNHPAHLNPENQPRGSAHALAKVTEEDVIAIRAAVASGETQTAVAGRYGLHKTNVSCIVRRVTWAHVDSQMAA